MSKIMNSQSFIVKFLGVLLISFVIISFADGTPLYDTTGQILLAALNKKDKAEFITKEPNIVFPEILCGNEEQSIDYIESFAGNRRDYIIRTYIRSQQFFPKVAVILKEHDLPNELKVLIALESAFKANAVSRAGAVGYWQFMDKVAKEYGLKIASRSVKHSKKKKVRKSYRKDDRRDFNKSTYAAARYLKDRGRNLNNDLLLMVASYNCGIGNVWNAIAKCGKTDATFWDIKNYLPAETRAYVMNFITLNVIFNNYDKFVDYTLSYKPEKIKLTNTAHQMTEEIY